MGNTVVPTGAVGWDFKMNNDTYCLTFDHYNNYYSCCEPTCCEPLVSDLIHLYAELIFVFSKNLCSFILIITI